MKKLVVLAALAFAGFTVSAGACDWNHEASNQPTVTADCTGAQCNNEAAPQGPMTTQQDSKPGQPAQDRFKEESWPVVTVADCGGNSGCK